MSSQVFLSTHKSYPNIKFPEIQMLVMQQMRVAIANVKVDNNTELEVARVIDEQGSNYHVLEISKNKCNRCNTCFIVATEKTLDAALSACNTLLFKARGLGAPVEDDELAYA